MLMHALQLCHIFLAQLLNGALEICGICSTQINYDFVRDFPLIPCLLLAF